MQIRASNMSRSRPQLPRSTHGTPWTMNPLLASNYGLHFRNWAFAEARIKRLTFLIYRSVNVVWRQDLHNQRPWIEPGSNVWYLRMRNIVTRIYSCLQLNTAVRKSAITNIKSSNNLDVTNQRLVKTDTLLNQE